MPTARATFGDDLSLPPLFRPVALREVGDAFAHAKAIAAEAGAGTLVYVGRFDLAEFAVVLEPNEPLRTARRAFYMGCAAVADALEALAPPEKPIWFKWPDALWIDAALVGGARLAWPDGADENEPPDWLVFGAMIRTVTMTDEEPGLRPLASALEDEGFDDVTTNSLVESFARHLMYRFDAWETGGFNEIAKTYLSRLAPEKGVRREIDDIGDLLVGRPGAVDMERRKLAPALLTPSWFDPASRGPRR